MLYDKTIIETEMKYINSDHYDPLPQIQNTDYRLLMSYFESKVSQAELIGNHLEGMQAILKTFVRDGYIEVQDKYVKCLREDKLYIILCKKLTEKIQYKRKIIEEILRYAKVHFNDIKCLYLDNEQIRDYAFLFFHNSLQSEVIYSILYLIGISIKIDEQTFFYSIMLRCFKQQYKNIDRLMDNPAELSLYVSVDSDLIDVSIYNYFLNKQGVECTNLFVIMTILCQVHEADRKISLQKGKIPNFMKGTSRKNFLDTNSSIQKRKLKKDMSTTELFKIFGYDNVSQNIMISKDTISMPVVSAELKATMELQQKKINEENINWLAPLAFSLTQYKTYSDSCLDYYFKHLTSQGNTYKTPVKEKDQKQIGNNCQEESLNDTQNKKDLEILELKKELQKVNKTLAHAQADKIRLLEKMNDSYSINENSEIEEYESTIPEESEENLLEDAIAYLSKKKIVVVGGHGHWIRQLQDIFPKWSFYVEETRIPQRAQDIDLVLFYWKYSSHCLYNKFISICRSKNIPKYTLSNSNIERLILQVYKFMINSLDP